MRGFWGLLGKIISFIGRVIVIIPQVIVELLAWVFVILQIGVGFIASASLYGSIVIVVLFIAGGVHNVVQMHDSILGTIILVGLAAGVVMFVYNLAASLFTPVLTSISIALGVIALAFSSIDSALEFVYRGVVRLAGKEVYDEYIKKENEKVYKREAKEAAKQRVTMMKEARVLGIEVDEQSVKAVNV